MSASQASRKALRSPVALIRISSILFMGLMVGHMSAYPWTSTQAPQEVGLTGLMKSIPFEFMGERSTYWDLYFGWGLLVGALLLTLAIILWFLAGLARTGLRSVGAITGIISATSLVGACLSLRFFYVPPLIFFSIICVILMAAAVQLLRSQND